MESIPFLTVDNESISISQTLKYLRDAGSFQRVIRDVLRQYVLDKELKSREDMQVDSFRIDQAIMDFRIQGQLTDPNSFRQWLMNNGITYDELQERIAFGLNLEKFKTEITETKLEEYFIQQKPLLDMVVICRIIVSEKELADNLKQQILADKSRFELLAKKYSLTPERVANGYIGAIKLGTLPDNLRAAVDSAPVGEVMGPFEVDGRYCLLRVEEFQRATLEGALKQELQNQLFEQWLQQKLEKMTVKLEVK